MGYIPPASSSPNSLLSHQTGLNVTATAADTPYAIGSSITIPRNGKLLITTIAHASAAGGYIDFTLTRGGTIFYLGMAGTPNSTTLGSSLFVTGTSWIASSSPSITFISNTTATTYINVTLIAEILVLSGDVIQFRGAHHTASDITYLDDLVVSIE